MSVSPFGSADNLRPCIAELLRTNHYPDGLIIRIDKILETTKKQASRTDEADVNEDQQKRIYRLLLSDGELSVQAVLNRNYHHLLENKTTSEGQLIELRRYSVKRAPRINGSGEVIYICIDEYCNHGLPNLENEALHTDSKTIGVAKASHTLKRTREMISEPQLINLPNIPQRKVQIKRRQLPHISPGDDSDSDDFETADQPITEFSKRREVLRDISGNSQLQWSADRRLTIVMADMADVADTTDHIVPDVQADVQAEDQTALISAEEPNKHDPPAGVTLKLHTLASLLDPDQGLPPRNYACKVFAVITWVSSAILKRPGLPEKRHIKVHDPSITRRYSGISISIFVNARHFRPAIGTIALFTGVTAQRWDREVILNAYEKDCAGKDWFITDETRLKAEGLAVEELKLWWQKRNQRSN